MNNTTITLTGNVGSTPEHRMVNSSTSVTKFRLAATERRYDRASEKWIDAHTSWYAVSVFRELGDHAFRSLSLGDRVIVVGGLKIRQWESGGKQGADAEVDAIAIGPDLRWGTTSFTRTTQAGRRTADEPDRGGDAQDSGWHPASSGSGTDDMSLPAGAGYDPAPSQSNGEPADTPF